MRDRDKIIVLKHGLICEEGSHDELLQRENGYYKRLWEKQSEQQKKALEEVAEQQKQKEEYEQALNSRKAGNLD